MSDETNDEINEKNKIKKIESINFPTLKEGESWDKIGEKIIQASFLEKPFKVLEEVSNNLIPNMNDNFDVLNNDITKLNNNFVSLKKTVEENDKISLNNFEGNTLVRNEIWA